MVKQLSNQIKEGGSIPTSPLQFTVQGIPAFMTHEWLLKKHYAHRLPSISYAYGLYANDYLQGVITFGSFANFRFNDGECIFNKYRCKVLELNRLVVNDSLPHNTLSHFVSMAIKIIPIRPLCIISYSDPNKGHHGYIYQATNWLYT